jgi:hypothetical protein
VILHQAAETLTVLIDAASAWVQAFAGGSAFVLCVAAFVALGARPAPTSNPARRHPARPSWARGALIARIYAARRTRHPAARTPPLPLWAHTQPHQYDEAA